MELRVLRYFLEVAREENVTRAAGRLHISQPTLSRLNIVATYDLLLNASVFSPVASLLLEAFKRTFG